MAGIADTLEGTGYQAARVYETVKQSLIMVKSIGFFQAVAGMMPKMLGMSV